MTERSGSELLTFLIADVRGYSTFTTKAGDEAAARLAAAFAEIAREVVEAYGGNLLGLRGDEAVGAFGSARQALRAAVEMQGLFADETARDPSMPLTVGIGLDAGEAVPVEGDYRSGGLNLAARLCAAAGPGEILASQGVVHLARSMQDLRFADAGAREFKGFDGPVPVVEVQPTCIGDPARVAPLPRGAPGPVPVALDAASPMPGREREARTARLAWRRARRGQGGVVLITGEQGSGRTRLAAEVAAQAARDGARVLHADGAGDADALATLLNDLDGPPGDHAPTLAVIDDLDRSGPEDRARALTLLPDMPGRPLLLVATLSAAPEPRELRRLVDEVASGVTVVRVGPLDAGAVRAIAAGYGLGPEAAADLPTEQILAATDGNAARVQRAVAEWALRATTDRIAVAAARAATDWSDQRSREEGIARDLVDLQLARERIPAAGGAGETEAPSPFKGLATFEVTDAGWFFGRERLVADLLARIARSPFVGVVGPSGSGKSSLLRAGLLASLEAGLLPGSADWHRALVRPGALPLRSLERAVYAAAPLKLQAQLGDAARPLDALLAALAPGERIVIVVDQLEELFTQGADIAEQAAFVDVLADGLLHHPGRLVVVVGVRADLYGRCAAIPRLAALLGENHLLVGPMDRDEHRRAIERPALRAGLRIDPPLVDALLDEVDGEPGALPLLSTALFELWQRREGRVIPLRALVATGGVRGAVARLAERTYGGFSPAEVRVVRALLLRLTGVADDDTPVRRRIPLASLDAEIPEVRSVLDALATQRLVTVDEEAAELAHDALLREWPRLHGWVTEDMDGRRLHERLIVAARDWSARGEDPAELYRGARLAGADEWAASHPDEPNELERRFLAASRAAEDDAAARQARANRRLRALLATALAVLVVAVGAGLVAALQWRTADDQRALASDRQQVALGRQLIAESLLTRSDLPYSLLLALEAIGRAPDPEAWTNLTRALDVRPELVATHWMADPVIDLAVSPDGRRLAVLTGGESDTTGTLEVLETDTWARIGEPLRAVDLRVTDIEPQRGSSHMAFDWAGERVTFRGSEGLCVLDIGSGTVRVVPMTGGAAWIQDVAWTRGGQLAWFQNGSREGTPDEGYVGHVGGMDGGYVGLRTWDSATSVVASSPIGGTSHRRAAVGEPPPYLRPIYGPPAGGGLSVRGDAPIVPELEVSHAFLSDDAQWLAVLGDGGSDLYNLGTGTHVGSLPATSALAFTADHARLIVEDRESGSFSILGVPDLVPAGPPHLVDDMVAYAEAVGDDGSIRIWRSDGTFVAVGTGVVPATRQAVVGWVRARARTDNGTWYLGRGRGVERIDPGRESRFAVPVPEIEGGDWTDEVAVGDRGGIAVWWSRHGLAPTRRLRVTDRADGTEVALIDLDHRAGIGRVVVSADELAIVTLHDDGSIIRTDLATKEPSEIGLLSYEELIYLRTIVPLAGGAAFVLNGEEPSLILRAGGDRTYIPVLGRGAAQDATTGEIYVADCDGQAIRVVDPGTATVTRSLSVQGCPEDVAIRGGGEILVLMSEVTMGESRMRIDTLDSTSWRVVATFAVDYPGTSLRVDAATDTAIVDTYGPGLTLDRTAWVASACTAAGRDLTTAEWDSLMGDEARRSICPDRSAMRADASPPAAPAPSSAPSWSPGEETDPSAPIGLGTPTLVVDAAACREVTYYLCWVPPGPQRVTTFVPALSLALDGSWYRLGQEGADLLALVRSEGETIRMVALPLVAHVPGDAGVRRLASADDIRSFVAESGLTVGPAEEGRLGGWPAVRFDARVDPALGDAELPLFDHPLAEPNGAVAFRRGATLRFLVTEHAGRQLALIAEAPTERFPGWWAEVALPVVGSVVFGDGESPAQ